MTITTHMTSRELRAFRILFLISAIWNFAGALPALYRQHWDVRA